MVSLKWNPIKWRTEMKEYTGVVGEVCKIVKSDTEWESRIISFIKTEICEIEKEEGSIITKEHFVSPFHKKEKVELVLK